MPKTETSIIQEHSQKELREITPLLKINNLVECGE
jgi:hypothetical protein